MNALSVNPECLLGRLRELGQIGRDGDGKLVRLAGSDADKAGRNAFVAWLRQAGLEVAVDRIGNIFGIWKGTDNADQAPILIGSHIDTVIDAGIYDGCYGVLSGLAVIETLKAAGFVSARPLAVAAFTNEEGVRYAPDMMGSLVYAGGLSTEAALATTGTDGTSAPYPSAIQVQGLRKGKVKDVNLTLRDWSHSFSNDVDILLVAPNGRNALVMSDITLGPGVSTVTLILDDEAAMKRWLNDPDNRFFRTRPGRV